MSLTGGPGQGTNARKEERCKEYQMHRSLHHVRAAGAQSHGAQDEGNGEQYEVTGLQAQNA